MRITRWLVIASIGAVVIATAADLTLTFTGRQTAPLVGADLVGYWPVFALVSGFVIIYGAKFLGALLVQRDHKDEKEPAGDE